VVGILVQQRRKRKKEQFIFSPFSFVPFGLDVVGHFSVSYLVSGSPKVYTAPLRICHCMELVVVADSILHMKHTINLTHHRRELYHLYVNHKAINALGPTSKKILTKKMILVLNGYGTIFGPE
jgi:hypothetical protein